MAVSIYSVIFGSAVFLISFYNKKFIEKDQEKSFPTANPLFSDVLPQIEEFDFIVIGGGTAGSIVVNKLSEKYSVLLIEAGGDPLPFTKIPLYYHVTNQLNSTVHKWKSIKQKHSGLGIDNGRVYIAQGKGLGGSTLVNGMSYNRGHPKDYDNWGNLTDESWNYENLLPFFKATENFFEHEKNTDHLGFEGPMFISKNEAVFDEKTKQMYNNWIRAGEELGYEEYENPNAPQREGFGTLTTIKKNGLRFTAFDGFIKPILNRKNLKIVRYSEAKKIELNEDGRAVGVHYCRHGVKKYASVKKEIILSAGSLNSPLVLMRSGIGPRKSLEEAGVEVKLDLPVGQKFQDHPSAFLYEFQLGEDYYSNVNPKDEIQKFIKSGKGSVANLFDIFGQAFLVSEESKKEGHPDWCDIQFITGINSTILANGDDKVFIYVVVGRPTSYGTVKLDKDKPHEKPLILDFNYLETERDINVFSEALKIASRVFDSGSFQSIGGRIIKDPLEQCSDHKYASDDYWKCYARQMTVTIWHPTGTCRMGKEDDETRVVDTRLKVRGIENLRVIDNSIQPMITNANTMSPAFVIGQKGVQMVLEDNA